MTDGFYLCFRDADAVVQLVVLVRGFNDRKASKANRFKKEFGLELWPYKCEGLTSTIANDFNHLIKGRFTHLSNK
jgi:hypothetical protein